MRGAATSLLMIFIQVYFALLFGPWLVARLIDRFRIRLWPQGYFRLSP